MAIGALFVAIYGFFAVLFTGRWPRGAFDYLVGTFRWVYRVVAFFHLMTDAYPPFSLADDPDFPGLRWNLRGNAYAYFMTDRHPPLVWG